MCAEGSGVKEREIQRERQRDREREKKIRAGPDGGVFKFDVALHFMPVPT